MKTVKDALIEAKTYKNSKLTVYTVNNAIRLLQVSELGKIIDPPANVLDGLLYVRDNCGKPLLKDHIDDTLQAIIDVIDDTDLDWEATLYIMS